MRILTVIGNRPQFIKAAAVSQLLRAEHSEILVHTGQHYDDELSEIFIRELGLPRPDRELGIAGGTNTSQTSRQLAALELVVGEITPDLVLVYGDTNSTLAGALVTDHLSTLLLCTSQVAPDNLAREGVLGTVELVGDVMADIARLMAPRARERTQALAGWGVEPGGYVLATAHRAANVDDPQRLALLVDLLTAIELPVVLPLHPRTRARLEQAGLLGALESAPTLEITPPLGYLDFTTLLCSARAVLTDSGGAQKEAYFAAVPAITMRDRTEWVETVETGWNILVDLDKDAALAALERPLPSEHP
ncbi:MAG: UDP-N-acetyl glucosamine 2-epimerase [Solirubrobacterales bacterium]|nr:UDP-N-acetyl glucosamine 2-epimerase [Solirubrobacterales bacterium]